MHLAPCDAKPPSAAISEACADVLPVLGLAAMKINCPSLTPLMRLNSDGLLNFHLAFHLKQMLDTHVFPINLEVGNEVIGIVVQHPTQRLQSVSVAIDVVKAE